MTWWCGACGWRSDSSEGPDEPAMRDESVRHPYGERNVEECLVTDICPCCESEDIHVEENDDGDAEDEDGDGDNDGDGASTDGLPYRRADEDS